MNIITHAISQQYIFFPSQACHKHACMLWIGCVRIETALDPAEMSQLALGSPGLFQVIKCCRHAGFRINYISLSGLFKGSESSGKLKIEFLKVTFLFSWWSISEASGLHPVSAQPETRERCWLLKDEFKYSIAWEYSAEAQKKQFTISETHKKFHLGSSKGQKVLYGNLKGFQTWNHFD